MTLIGLKRPDTALHRSDLSPDSLKWERPLGIPMRPEVVPKKNQGSLREALWQAGVIRPFPRHPRHRCSNGRLRDDPEPNARDWG